MYIMEEEATQPTQDPRRLGRNNSGINDADIADVLCILHPCSPAAFKIVASTAELAPQNVLQNHNFDDYGDGVSQAVLEEQRTFILGSGSSAQQPMDLALRFSTHVLRPHLGFVFGRNAAGCDIFLGTDTVKRVSNMHFRIFMNSSGVLMLADTSTNGTVVDDIVLRGKHSPETSTRMLQAGSIVQILSPKAEEVIKFIIRVPSREGHHEEYAANYQAYMQRIARAAIEAEQFTQPDQQALTKKLAWPTKDRTQSGGAVSGPLVSNQFGMKWSGGEKYNVVGQIGKGAFATVYQLATKSDGQLFAAKELEKRKFMKNGVLDRKVDNELQIMRSVNHPNIVNFVDYHDVANHLYIIMEFVACGDLQRYLSLHQPPRPLSEPLARHMAAQVFAALDYLHQKKITHRDIKPDNILIASLDEFHFNVKLSDFGLSKVVKDNDTFLKTFCGTLLYCAPEVFPHYDAHVAGKGKKRQRKGPSAARFHSYSQSVDIWSFGAVLWYSLCAKPPFEGVTGGQNGKGMFDKIMMTPLDSSDLVKKGVSDDAIALLLDMLNTDPGQRPSPAYCSRHPWFGFGQMVSAGNAETGLEVIAEEQDAGQSEEPDVSGLSLDEQDSPHDSQNSDFGFTSSDMRFFADARQSKRFKSGALAYREQDSPIASSPEMAFDHIPIVNQAENAMISQLPRVQRKLFGEISQSALQSPAALVAPGAPVGTPANADGGSHQEHAVSLAEEEQKAQTPSKEGAVASPSLLGAESLVRDMNMDSPSPPTAETSEPTTPNTPEKRPGSSTNHGSPTEITPRAAPRSAFNRQINLPITPSFFYDPHDPSTHSVEYAARVSGYDFTTQPSEAITESTDAGSGSATDADPDIIQKLSSVATPEFLKPPPRLGRLTPTPESFSSVTLNLTSRYTCWGRLPDNTLIYQDSQDTRVAKRALMIWFHSKSIDEIPESDDSWTRLPDLHCILLTESRAGVYVNGVLLKRTENGKRCFGRIYTGDEITIWQANQNKPGLRFVCEIFHGEARERRPVGGPMFTVEMESTTNGKSHSSAGRVPDH